jgi:hypothetical protein
MNQLAEDRQGRDAYHRHAWHEAFDLLREADSKISLGPKDLALLGGRHDLPALRNAAVEAHDEHTPVTCTTWARPDCTD